MTSLTPVAIPAPTSRLGNPPHPSLPSLGWVKDRPGREEAPFLVLQGPKRRELKGANHTPKSHRGHHICGAYTPRSLCGFTKPGLRQTLKPTVPPFLPVPSQMALSSLGRLFPSLRDEAFTPHLNSCDELWEGG